MKKISIIGILSGFFFAIIILISLNLIMVLFFKHFLLNGRIDLIPSGNLVLSYAVFVIFISSAIGGFIATRISKRHSFINAFIVGSFLVLYFLFLDFMDIEQDLDNSFPAWIGILGYFVMIPASLLGGYLHTRRLNQ